MKKKDNCQDGEYMNMMQYIAITQNRKECKSIITFKEVLYEKIGELNGNG